MSDEHESFIRTPKQLIWVVFLSFAIPIVIIVLLVTFIGATDREGAGADNMTPEAIEQRIRPVAGFQLADASGAGAGPRSGEAVYTAVCAACHAAGVAGAPKLGDKAAWAPRIEQGLDALVSASINGKGAMPPQKAAGTDVEIARAVVHLANSGGADFEEPKAEETGGQQTAAAPAAPATPTDKATGTSDTARGEPRSAPVGGSDATPAKPPAQVAPAGAAPAAQDVSDEGQKLYASACAVCHAAGVAGAPKTGDKAAWEPRIAAGMDTLYQSSLKGKGAMPPKGGRLDASDEAVRAAVDHMVAQSK